MVRIAFAILLLLAIAPAARADLLLQPHCPWDRDLPASVAIASDGANGGGEAFLVGPTTAEGIKLITVDTSSLATTDIALSGKLALTHTDHSNGTTESLNITGTAILVLDAEYPDGHHASSKSSFNPSAHSFWIDFRLTMHSDKVSPKLVTLRVILTGRDEFMLSDSVELWDITPADANAWWNPHTGSWISGLIGATFVVIGAIVGILLSRSKSLRLATALSRFTMLASVLILLAGIVAICLQQPFAVYVPLILNGILATTLFASLLLMTRRLCRQIELRKIQVLDTT